jgi:CRP/FNR family transcriptional regulator
MKHSTEFRSVSPLREPPCDVLSALRRSAIAAPPPRREEEHEEPHGRRQPILPRSHIFREGDWADRVYQLIDGAVMLYKLLPDGRRQVVELLSAGDVFGLSGLAVYNCSAETLAAGTVIAYDRAAAERSPTLARLMSAHVRAQFCALHEHALLLGRKSALERVASFIMRCLPGGEAGGQHDGSAVARLGMTRQEIADYVGVTLETVSRAFSKLRRLGVITIEKQEEVLVNDVRRMCRLTGTT